MKSKWGQIIVVILTLIGVGEVLRFPQQSLTAELKKEGFIPERLSQEKQLKVGQTSYAIVLGGLRSLVASFMDLQAFSEFEKQDWEELEQLYDVIVTLQPRNTFYWESAGWHLAYNAYYDFESKPRMAAARRRLKQKEYHKKGENMLLRGTEEIPDSVGLWVQLARMHCSPHKPYNFPKAAQYYEKAIVLPGSKPVYKRAHFYVLGRIPDKADEAWKIGAELMGNPRNQKYSSLRSQFYVLTLLKNPEAASNDKLIDTVFRGNRKEAYQDLVNYWCRSEREQFPRANVDVVIKRLAQELSIKDEHNPFKNPKLRRLVGEF